MGYLHSDFINGVTMLKALLIYWEEIIQKENKDSKGQVLE